MVILMERDEREKQMTNEQAKKMLKAKLECLKRETSGTDFDCNNSNCDECSLCYEQGNMGEQKEALDMAIKALEQQPCEDTISRQAAIDALWKALYTYEDETERRFQESDELNVGDWIGHRIFVQNMNDIDRQTILNLPSAQPEQLTDAEQRIFLKAIEREEKVCKKVDEEWGSGDEECEINLVHACHEIIRKVKGALWT